MSEIVVIHSQNDGLWHLCYNKPGTLTFLSFQSFISKDLAEAMAWKMNKSRPSKNNGA